MGGILRPPSMPPSPKRWRCPVGNCVHPTRRDCAGSCRSEKAPAEGAYSLPELEALGKAVPESDYLSRREAATPYDVVNMQYTSGRPASPRA